MSLIKLSTTNPMQMAIGKTLKPMQNLHFDRLTSAAAAAKKNVPGALEKMHQASKSLKEAGVNRIDTSKKLEMLKDMKKPLPHAGVIPFNRKNIEEVAKAK